MSLQNFYRTPIIMACTLNGTDKRMD